MLSLYVDVEKQQCEKLLNIYNTYDQYKKNEIERLSTMVSKTIEAQCIKSTDTNSKGIYFIDFKSLILKEYEDFYFDQDDVLLEIALLKAGGYLVHRYSYESHIKGLDVK